MNSIKPVLVFAALVVSVVMSLAGAVNSGFSYFFMAVPFMALLVVLSRRYGVKYRNAAIVFITLCILVSVTQSHNPLLSPILSGGTATILQDGYFVLYPGGGGLFYTESEIRSKFITNPKNPMDAARVEQFINDPGTKNLVSIKYPNDGLDRTKVDIIKLKKGEVYPVIGIEHNHGDFGDHINVDTSIGQFYHNDLFPLPQDGESAIALNKPVQSRWSRNLGNLMIYPAIITSPRNAPELLQAIWK